MKNGCGTRYLTPLVSIDLLGYHPSHGIVEHYTFPSGIGKDYLFAASCSPAAHRGYNQKREQYYGGYYLFRAIQNESTILMFFATLKIDT